MKRIQAAARRALLPLALVALAACSSGGKDGPAPRTLTRISVSPASPQLVAGTSMSLTATAFWSDQTSGDVTEQAAWTSSNDAVLSVSTAAGTRGLADALAAGPATVTAAYGGLSGTASATVHEAGAGVTIAGTVTYDFVPATYDPDSETGTLAFGASSPRPVRGAVVRVVQGTTVLAQATTDETGGYVIPFVGTGTVSVVALAKTLSPPIQVEDNRDGNSIWAIGALDLPAANATVPLHATHGWTGTGYDAGARQAAPFAVLDSMYTAAKGFVDAGRDPPYPALRVNWSPDNSSATIITSHYAPAEGEIYILGKEGEDTDEFDSHVIVHEWAHYFEDKLSRSDSPGGAHGGGDALDPRLAFGEGFGSAMAAMLLQDPIYSDTWWVTPGSPISIYVGFDAETVPSPSDDYGPLNPGPFSEMSIIRALYDLWDGASAGEAWDGAAIPLGTIYDVLVGPQKSTDALTTIASFVAGLKDSGASGAAVDAVLARYSIGAITDAWGTGDPDLAAMFRSVAVPSSGHSFSFDGRYDDNMQQRNRYLWFTAPGSSVTISLTSDADTHDIDLYAYRRGELVASRAYTGRYETMTLATTPGTIYVVRLFGYSVLNGTYSATVSLSTP